MKSFNPKETIKVIRSILDIDQNLTGMSYLRIIVKNIGKTFNTKFAFAGHRLESEKQTIKTDVVWAGNNFVENFNYELRNTPCENVMSGNRVCVYTNDVVNLFPKDELLKQMGVESYVGAPILDTNRKLSGILVLLDDKGIDDVEFYTAIVEFLAMRVGAELDRHYIQESLKRQVIERTGELERTNQNLKRALTEVKTLRGCLPICANCKKIRDDEGLWHQVEAYLSNHSDVVFTHSICSKCVDELYGNSFTLDGRNQPWSNGD